MKKIIKEEIQLKNDWAKVNEVIKFPNSSTIKVIFNSTAMREKCCVNGLTMFYLFVNGKSIAKDKYIQIKTCFKCYAVGSHVTTECPQSSTYKV